MLLEWSPTVANMANVGAAALRLQLWLTGKYARLAPAWCVVAELLAARAQPAPGQSEEHEIPDDNRHLQIVLIFRIARVSPQVAGQSRQAQPESVVHLATSICGALLWADQGRSRLSRRDVICSHSHTGRAKATDSVCGIDKIYRRSYTGAQTLQGRPLCSTRAAMRRGRRHSGG